MRVVVCDRRGFRGVSHDRPALVLVAPRSRPARRSLGERALDRIQTWWEIAIASAQHRHRIGDARQPHRQRKRMVASHREREARWMNAHVAALPHGEGASAERNDLADVVVRELPVRELTGSPSTTLRADALAGVPGAGVST